MNNISGNYTQRPVTTEPLEETQKPYVKGPYIFNEAFCLMWYTCKCGHRERIWNSRDGITPFAMSCPSCGNATLQHTHWNSDEPAPNHKLHEGQRFWRDGTPDDAEAIMTRRLDSIPKDSPYRVDAEKRAELIAIARSGKEHEFAPGWPKLDIFGETG